MDDITKINFLVDSGAVISCYPRSLTKRRLPASITLTAANQTRIPTYGIVTLSLDLRLRRTFKWNFVVADVNQPIIGADFLEHFNLLVDLKNKKVIDRQTNCAAGGKCYKAPISNITPIHNNSDYSYLLAKYPMVINPNLHHRPKVTSVTHCILTKGPPVFAKPRRLSPEKLQALKDQFRDLMEQGIIQPSKSPWSSPVHFVKKPDGTWRICGDFRHLNNVTQPDRYGIPHIQDICNGLAGKRIFSKLDLSKAFYQIPVQPEDVPKTAVTTPIGLYEFKYMAFGLRNASQTMQRYIDQVLRDLPCISYIDDVLIASPDEDSHHKDLDKVFNALQQHGLVINPDKCIFGVKSLNFLGYKISEAGLEPLPEKVSILQNYKKPETVRELVRFLAALNFYRRFLKGIATIQAPLYALTHGRKKNDKTVINWTEETEAAFEACKKQIAQATLLNYPRPDAEYSVIVDSSDFAIGGALQQRVKEEIQPLAFFSKKLSSTERKYSTFDRELLAAYSAVKHFRHMLEGRQFTIYTDHRPLTHALAQVSERSPRQTRHLEYIAQFTSDIRFIPGVKNSIADALSRISAISVSGNIDFEAIAQEQEEDEELKQLLSSETKLQLQKVNIPNCTVQIFCDLSTGTARPYVPRTFRRQVFDAIHGLAHGGTNVSSSLVRQRYVWPGIDRDCRKWAKCCIKCQRAKVHKHTRAPLSQFPPGEYRFSHVHIDIVGPLPEVKGYRYLLTCVERTTRWPEVYPLHNQTAETIGMTFYDNWISRFGVPNVITTDRGTNFESLFFTSLCRFIGARRIRTTAYHPQSNSLVERFHRQMKAALLCHTSTWLEALPSVLLGIRASLKADLQASPAELLYGSTLRLPGDFFTDTDFQPATASETLHRLRATVTHLRSSPVRRHGTPATFLHKDLATCTHVFVRRDGASSKFSPTYQGPHLILKRNDKFFTLDLEGRKDNVSIDRLKPAYIWNDDQSSPEPIISEEQPTGIVTRTGRISKPVVRFSASA